MSPLWQFYGVCCPNQGGVAGSKFGLEQGGFEIGMPDGISSRRKRRSRSKIAPAQRVAAACASRVVAHAGKAYKGFTCMSSLALKRHGARNNSHPVLGNRSIQFHRAGLKCEDIGQLIERLYQFRFKCPILSLDNTG